MATEDAMSAGNKIPGIPTGPVPFVSREEWGAMPPTITKTLQLPAYNIIFTYCTDHKDRKFGNCKTQEECTKLVQDMQKYYMEERKKRDIPYSFLIGGDGRVYEGRGWSARPLRNKKYPKVFRRIVNIAYIGDYHEKRPPKNMWHAAWDFCTESVGKEKICDDFEFFENYDEKKLDEIMHNKPWYDKKTYNYI